MAEHKSEPLGEIEVLFDRNCQSCEDISIVSEQLYTGHGDGRLLRFSLTGDDRLTEIVRFKRPATWFGGTWRQPGLGVRRTGRPRPGRPVAGTYEIVTNSFNDTTFQLIDYLDVAASGNVYFTDASDKFGDDNLQYDVLEGRPHGALYRYNVTTNTTERILDDLYFANGVVVDPAEEFVLVAETSGFRIQKLWLKGPKAGQTEIFYRGLTGLARWALAWVLTG